MTKSIVVYILTIAMVAGGIIAALPFIPTMHYSLAEWAVTHRLDLIGSAIACFVVGLLFTRRFVLGFMLALASPIFFWGVFLSLNGALDKHPGMTEKFIVVLKDKEYIENGNNPGYWNYYLTGENKHGDRFKFSTGVSHISKQEWNNVDLNAGHFYVRLRVFPGRFGVPWRKIEGVYNADGIPLDTH